MSHCVHCGADGAGQFCAACGRSQADGSAPPPAPAPPPAGAVSGKRKGIGCLPALGIGALGLLGLVVLLAILGGSQSGSKPSSLNIGAVLKFRKECPSMPTRKGWDEFRSAMNSGDHMAASRLILEQGGRFVPAGTTVMIKDFGFFDAVEATDQTADIHMGEHLFFARACVGE